METGAIAMRGNSCSLDGLVQLCVIHKKYPFVNSESYVYNGIFERLEPVVFKDFSIFGNLKKNLEELIVKSILDVLFEDSSLMPIFQERQFLMHRDNFLYPKTEEITGMKEI